MKSASSGISRKLARPARKSAGKRSVRTKSATSKAKPLKTAKLKRVKAAAKPKAARKKVARKKVARKKIAKGKVAKEVKLPVAAPTESVAPAKPKRKLVRRTSATLSRKIEPKPTERVERSTQVEAAEKSAVKAESATVAPKQLAAPKKQTTKISALASKASPDKPEIPAFLLEGDEPSHPELSGPGEKFVLGPTTPLDHFDEAKAPLPESYGTGKVFLTVRDPHWLYAHWDLPREEQFRHNARSEDRHLILRVYEEAKPAAPPNEIHVHPESKHWFVHVNRAGESYTTELGYYQRGHKWQSLGKSESKRTPPDNISPNATVKFATIPPELSFETMLRLLKEVDGAGVFENAPLAQVVDKIKPQAREHFPKSDAPDDWTAEQEEALAAILAEDRARVTLPSSDQFTKPEAEKVWPEFVFDSESGDVAPYKTPSSYVSSFFGGAEQKNFWLNVNAELVIYGATEPNATVTFAGKKIPLRPDGSFRFRFALPDGQFELPITAVAADESDARAVELKFSRATETRGQVETHPQDPVLHPPPKET